MDMGAISNFFIENKLRYKFKPGRVCYAFSFSKKPWIQYLCILSLFLSGFAASAEENTDISKEEFNKKQINTEVIKKIPLPKGYHEGIFLYDEKVFVCNGRGLGTYIINPEKEKVTGKLEPFGSFTEGIAPGLDGKFWLTDWEEKKLYKVRIEEKNIIAQFEISLAPNYPAGVIQVGKTVYVILWSRGIIGTKYYIVRLDEKGAILRKQRIAGISEPAHLAWDGEYLWITSWYSQEVFQMDIDTLKIVRKFKSPVKKTTGIAWDGTHFWITGTSADLYQIKLDLS